jgi:hypothetical protein
MRVPDRYTANKHLKGSSSDAIASFVAAYNFARRLKTLKGLTPYEHIRKVWLQA